ncbi:phosphatase PAP2 family protein [Aneurinibacillus aneurinilyticus]|uniref:Phosphatase PAP2 family protein n=1 Tax=Aneurinibacillus aneurinilyticus TaxID=1391 RepID=A0A848CUL7_ANEAE|nr:phosphatase PAP2 family protein [Aneurinibacillus aneurinilyticus]NME97617.1 phosphatase PAP2 family protein [Aneurinibacillus aneurinilyticus]
MEAILSFDRQLFHWLNVQLNIPALDWFMILVSAVSDKGLFWFLIVIVLLLIRQRVGGLRPAATLFAGIGIGGVIEYAMKFAIMRPRPPAVEEQVIHLTHMPISSSFPSGHAVSSFVSMYVLYRLFPKSIRWTLPCALIMAYSRIYVGVHYPLDVIGGAIIGIIAGKITMRVPVMKIAYKILSYVPIIRRYILPNAEIIPQNSPAETPFAAQKKQNEKV